ncbi:MAG: flgI [Belnapia sp.]|nr:flgI [Belnapia sp.]
MLNHRVGVTGCKVGKIAFARAKTAWSTRAFGLLLTALMATVLMTTTGLMATAGLGAFARPAAAQSVRIKDIADVEGVRDNQLVGYGLVVGLAGTGDRLRTAIFTRQSLIGMLERLGVNTRDNEARLDTRNVAAVMVTANLPAFSRPGSRIDIAVSALGDATNLQGGILLVTPLLGADGEVYAVAQGAVATSAVAARGAGASVQRGVPTSARIASGAIVEREVPYALTGRAIIRLSLRNPDLTTARRLAVAINRGTGSSAATATDPRTVVLAMGGRDPVGFLAEIEQLRVEPDQVARVVIEEASGTIVMGANVRVSTVAIAQGNLTIRITETPQVSQPNAFGQGETQVVPRTAIEVDDQAERRVGVLNGGVSLQELVRGLNALGVGPRDLIAILQSVKAAGALQAEMELR